MCHLILVEGLNLVPEATNIIIKGFGVSPHTTIGEVRLTPTIHGRSFPSITFHVVPMGTVAEPIVLGHPFLMSNHVLVDNARNRLTITDPSEDSFWEYYVGDKDQHCHQVCYGVEVVAVEVMPLTDSEASCIPVTVSFQTQA